MMAVGEGSDVECTLADGVIVVEVVWRSMVWTCLSILLELVMLEWYRSLETCVYVADGRWGHWNFDWMLRRLHRRHDYIIIVAVGLVYCSQRIVVVGRN